MKISKRTVDVLKNFSSINPSILLKEGNVVSTMAPSKKIVASATVEETFDRDVGIYELARFLGVMGLLKDPDLELGESSMTITSEGRTLEYVYSAPETIVTPPEKGIKLPSVDASFRLPAKALSELIKAAGVLGLTHVVMSGNGTVAKILAVDVKNPSSHRFEIDLDPCTEEFSAVFKVEVFKMIPEDYQVEISSKGISKFEGGGLTYYLAAEKEKA